MLELRSLPADVVGCYARPDALDPVAEEPCVRIALDELLLLDRREQLAQLEADMLRLDADSLVIDVSCAFAAWSLRGDGRSEAFRRLSAIPLPDAPASMLGLVAHVPAKVLVRDDELLVLVSAAVSHHLRERVLAACADLEPVEHGAADEEP